MPALLTTYNLQAALHHRNSLYSKIPLVPHVAHTHGATLCPTTTTGPLCGAIRLYAPLPFPHTEMQICGFLAALPLQSLLYAHHLPAQVPGLLLKSWQ